MAKNLADAAYQLRKARLAESLLNRVVSSVEDWAKPSFHRAGHHASLMHLAAHRKNSALAFNRLVDLTESYARCRVSKADAAVAALAKSDQSLSLEELEDLPHHDRVGLEAFRDCLRRVPIDAGMSDETHDVDGTRQTTVHGHKQNRISYIYGRQPRALRPTVPQPGTASAGVQSAAQSPSRRISSPGCGVNSTMTVSLGTPSSSMQRSTI